MVTGDVYWFECRICGYDSLEAGMVLFVMPTSRPICPLCAEDNGRAVPLDLRPATEQECRKIILAKREETDARSAS